MATTISLAKRIKLSVTFQRGNVELSEAELITLKPTITFEQEPVLFDIVEDPELGYIGTPTGTGETIISVKALDNGVEISDLLEVTITE